MAAISTSNAMTVTRDAAPAVRALPSLRRDAAPALGDRMASRIEGLISAARAVDTGAAAQQAGGETGAVLRRLRALATEAASSASGAPDGGALRMEVSRLQQELSRLGDDGAAHAAALFRDNAAAALRVQANAAPATVLALLRA